MPNYSHGTKVSVASNEEPPYLTVGTDVSAKYKGAFCEAKITDVNKHVKLRVLFDGSSGSYLIDDTEIKEGSTLETGTKIEAKHPGKRQQTYVPATITKILDHSRYTVVFDDGDQCVLRRNSICLKSGKHFAESETLDQLPLTNPEHFGNPVKVGALELQHNNHHAHQQAQNNSTANNSGTVNSNNNNNGNNHHSNSNQQSSKISRGKAATTTTTATTSTNNTTTTATNNTSSNPPGRRGAKGRKRRESVNNGSKHAPEPDDDSVEDSQDSVDADSGDSNIKHESIEIGVKLMVRYGKGKVQNVYEAKVNKIETNSAGKIRYFVHYTGWNNRYDEWVTKNRIVSVVTEKQARDTKQSRARTTDPPSSNNSTTAANSANSTTSTATTTTTTTTAGKSPPTIVPSIVNEEPPVKTRRSKHADLNENSTQIMAAVTTVTTATPSVSSITSTSASSNHNESSRLDKETITKPHRETTTKSHRPRHSETNESITVASSTIATATISVVKSPPTIVSAPSSEEPPTKTRRSKNVDINESSTQVTPAVTSASSSASSISSITSTTASSSNNESSKSDKEPVTRSYRSRHADTSESIVTACSTSTTSAAKSPPTIASAPPIEEPPVKTRRSKHVDINESSTQITPAVTPASSSASSISSITSTTVSFNNNESSKSEKEAPTQSHKPRQIETNEFNSSSPSSRPAYSFCTDIDEPDCDKKISILQARIMALRQTYMSLKSELNDLDRRRKRPRTDRTSSSEHIKMENFV